MSGGSAIEEAYDFLSRAFLEENGQTSPLYLIIGLPGSGKSTYLTVLGDILGHRAQRYSFPYEGVDARWVKVEDLLTRNRATSDPKRLQQIRARVKDLVYDFGQDLHEKYISKQTWPPATARDEGDEVNPATYFLASELVRNMRTLARLVTLETSGEEYQEVLRNFKQYIQGVEPKNSIQRVLLDMMNIAEGFIVLIDPDNVDNDAIFRNFFMVLKEELQPRALNTFYRELGGQEVTQDGVINPAKVGDMRNLLSRLHSDDQRRRRFEEQLENEKRVARDRLLQILKKLEEGKDEILNGEDGKWLRGLEETLEKQAPAMVKGAREKALGSGQQRGNEVRERVITYYKGLTKVCAERIHDILREQLEKNRPPQTRSSIWDIKKKYDLSETFKVEIDEQSFAERPVRRFKSLKHIGVVVTKSDKYPIIYPPENYPKKKIPGCELHLRDIQDYLKLCGGAVRYYNASATGYTILAGGSHIPGRPNTHTPINILEPLFDMLNITA
jgi:hypothetical protein